MPEDLPSRLERARELLHTVRHAAMATVNEDGSPHNTPFFFACDGSLEHIYWASNPASLHSGNVERTGQLFVVLYDAFQGGGLYLRADNAHATEGAELETAHAVFTECAKRAGKKVAPPSHYSGTEPERIYVATVKQLWVNGAERNTEGFIICDRRFEITRKELLA
ncbi:MAG TPA: pyridoxamine 5'-phosphate oxidase family protein [Candidatus Saccharimonadales bacterium]|nr:pyridoxamine 5'-phosphate oxidase family protein [Candidatus Saccharimonadales bacterium]